MYACNTCMCTCTFVKVKALGGVGVWFSRWFLPSAEELFRDSWRIWYK